MGIVSPRLAIYRGSPEEVTKAIEADPVLRRAAERGLEQSRVLFDPDNPRRGVLQTWWRSAADAKKFFRANPSLSIRTDAVSVRTVGKLEVYVNPQSLKTRKR
jgi:hypothetical protein